MNLKMKTETIFIRGLEREIIFHIGKNELDNFDVIDKGSMRDLWFHAKDVSSCHIVGEIPEDIQSNKKMRNYIIKIGALLCKQNTDKLKSQKKVEIIYTTCKNIAKTDIPGRVITENLKSIFI